MDGKKSDGSSNTNTLLPKQIITQLFDTKCAVIYTKCAII